MVCGAAGALGQRAQAEADRALPGRPSSLVFRHGQFGGSDRREPPGRGDGLGLEQVRDGAVQRGADLVQVIAGGSRLPRARTGHFFRMPPRKGNCGTRR
jgi:hypothetical protein